MTPDARCEAEKPEGAGVVRALLARVGVAASAFLQDAVEYVRPDGVLVGTGAELVAGELRSGIWQRGDGDYQALGATLPLGWTGATAVNQAGTVASTCNDWTDPNGTGQRSADWADVSRWWIGGSASSCGSSAGTDRLYCVEQ